MGGLGRRPIGERGDLSVYNRMCSSARTWDDEDGVLPFTRNLGAVEHEVEGDPPVVGPVGEVVGDLLVIGRV